MESENFTGSVVLLNAPILVKICARDFTIYIFLCIALKSCRLACFIKCTASAENMYFLYFLGDGSSRFIKRQGDGSLQLIL